MENYPNKKKINVYFHKLLYRNYTVPTYLITNFFSIKYDHKKIFK